MHTLGLTEFLKFQRNWPQAARKSRADVLEGSAALSDKISLHDDTIMPAVAAERALIEKIQRGCYRGFCLLRDYATSTTFSTPFKHPKMLRVVINWLELFSVSNPVYPKRAVQCCYPRLFKHEDSKR